MTSYLVSLLTFCYKESVPMAVAYSSDIETVLYLLWTPGSSSDGRPAEWETLVAGMMNMLHKKSLKKPLLFLVGCLDKDSLVHVCWRSVSLRTLNDEHVA